MCTVHSYLSRVGSWRQAGFSKPTFHRACFSASACSISESEVGWPWVWMRHNYQQCFSLLFKALDWVVRYATSSMGCCLENSNTRAQFNLNLPLDGGHRGVRAARPVACHRNCLAPLSLLGFSRRLWTVYGDGSTGGWGSRTELSLSSSPAPLPPLFLPAAPVLPLLPRGWAAMPPLQASPAWGLL